MTTSPSPDQTPSALARVYEQRMHRSEQLYGLTKPEMLALAMQITGRRYAQASSKSELLIAILNCELPFPSRPSALTQGATVAQ